MISMRKRMKDNRGFSLITVILAVAFIAILGLLVLYLALQDFRMKATDIKGKDSFYTAEQALEEIRMGLQQDVGDAMSTAYIKVMEAYNKDSQSTDAVMDELRQKDFESTFLSELTAHVRAAGDDGQSALPVGQYSLDYLRNYVDLDTMEDFYADKETLIVTTSQGKTPSLESDPQKGLLLKNLKVIYVDAKGLAAVIETDIRLGIPKVQFPTPSTLPDLMNMIVVADSGIVCQRKSASDTSDAPTTITGSIYAGNLQDTDTSDNTLKTSIQVEKNANLQITSGDKVVTSGEIRLDTQSHFSTNSGVTLWTEGIRLTEADVSLGGTTYLSDDLTVEKTEKNGSSKITIAGEYYGYGSSDSARKSRNYTQSGEMFTDHLPRLYDRLNDADLNSAIVVNGRNTTIDLSGVQKFLLAGRSYIASSGLKGKQSNNQDVLLGESLSVKGSQLAYLVPASLLKTGDKVTASNPMNYDDYLESDLPKTAVKDQVDWTQGVAAWGGQSLSDMGVDDTQPIQTVFYNDNAGGGYVYFYLNFTDRQKASDFMQTYYSENSQTMHQYLSFYFGDDSGITVNDQDAYLRYVTNGNILTYNGAQSSGSLKDATDPEADEKLQQEQLNMQNTWYALNRKMITSVDLLSTDVKDSDNISHDETSYTRSVFDNLVNEKQMVQFLKKQNPTGLRYTFTSSAEDGNLQALMVHNGESSSYQVKSGSGEITETVQGTKQPLVITKKMAEEDNLRLVICTGNVEIQSGVNFKGIIMAKGKITLKAGAKLESAPLDAAKVFQSVIGNAGNEVSPKDFFWEGDKYVLGNSHVTEDNNEGNSDKYQLGDYITYENWRKE